METSTRRIRRRLEQDGGYLSSHGSAHDIYRHPHIDGIVTLPSPPGRNARRGPFHRQKGWLGTVGDSQ